MDARPRSTTSTPCERTPSLKAAASSTPDGPHVAGHEDLGHGTALVEGEAGEGRADGAARRRRRSGRGRSPDVVGLEDGVEVCHGVGDPSRAAAAPVGRAAPAAARTAAGSGPGGRARRVGGRRHRRADARRIRDQVGQQPGASRTTWTVDRSEFSTSTGTSVEREPVAARPGGTARRRRRSRRPAAAAEQHRGHVGAERLQPALGVAVAGRAAPARVAALIDPPADLAQRRGRRRPWWCRRGGGCPRPRPTRPRPGSSSRATWAGRVGEVGVGEGEGAPARRPASRPAPRRPCPGCAGWTTTGRRRPPRPRRRCRRPSRRRPPRSRARRRRRAGPARRGPARRWPRCARPRGRRGSPATGARSPGAGGRGAASGQRLADRRRPAVRGATLSALPGRRRARDAGCRRRAASGAATRRPGRRPAASSTRRRRRRRAAAAARPRRLRRGRRRRHGRRRRRRPGPTGRRRPAGSARRGRVGADGDQLVEPAPSARARAGTARPSIGGRRASSTSPTRPEDGHGHGARRSSGVRP